MIVPACWPFASASEQNPTSYQPAGSAGSGMATGSSKRTKSASKFISPKKDTLEKRIQAQKKPLEEKIVLKHRSYLYKIQRKDRSLAKLAKCKVIGNHFTCHLTSFPKPQLQGSQSTDICPIEQVRTSINHSVQERSTSLVQVLSGPTTSLVAKCTGTRYWLPDQESLNRRR